MSNAPGPQPASGSRFPQPTRQHSRAYVWIGTAGVVIALVIGIGLWMLSRSLPNPAAEPSRGAAPSVQQTTPAGDSAPPATTTLAPFTSRQEQVAAFYAPKSFASNYLAHTFDGGRGERALQTWPDQRIVMSFNNWWRMGCENPAQWPQVLVGIVDARSEFWRAHQSPPDNCAAYFNNSAGSTAEGRTRAIQLAMGTQPGQFQPYYFVFTQDLSRSDGTGLWFLTDRNQAEGPGPTTTG